VAVAAPREAESLGEEALAQLGDPWPIHGEQVVVEEDVAHTEVGEAPAEADDVVDAVEASLTARGGAIAEGARERTAARGDEARERRGAVVEDVRLEADREVGDEVPGGFGELVQRVAVEVGRARVDAHGVALPVDRRSRIGSFISCEIG